MARAEARQKQVKKVPEEGLNPQEQRKRELPV